MLPKETTEIKHNFCGLFALMSDRDRDPKIPTMSGQIMTSGNPGLWRRSFLLKIFEDAKNVAAGWWVITSYTSPRSSSSFVVYNLINVPLLSGLPWLLNRLVLSDGNNFSNIIGYHNKYKGYRSSKETKEHNMKNIQVFFCP